MSDKLWGTNKPTQSMARSLVKVYGGRTGKGNTKISSDISLAVPELGWFVSKDDLDKWFKRKNKLGDRKYEAVCEFLRSERFLKVVPEALATINAKESAISAGISMQQFVCNPFDTLNYERGEFEGYWELVCGETLRKSLPFSMKVSYHFYFKKVEGENFFIAHLYSFWRRNKVIFDHASGYLFFKKNRNLVFKGVERISKNELNFEMKFEEKIDESGVIFWLRRIDMPDLPDPEEEPWNYRSKSFFDKIEWSVIPKWK